jgi:sugar phosphate isomerase/epimerase
VQLDAAAAGLRPRELDRSARRDLAALLRRLQLAPSGLDLWIPPEHLSDPARSDRALDALLQAIELSADLARLCGSGPATVSVMLPATPDASLARQLADHAETHSVRIADHTVRTQPFEPGPIGIGIDPAALLLAGLDPSQQAARAGVALVSARLSDATLTGRTAPTVSSGRLDLIAYLASLGICGYTRPLILDLRGLTDQALAARAALANWG